MIIQALIQVIDKENTNVVITLIESSQNEQLLKDVQKIEQANASRPDDSGYACVVAILNDESVYEIREKTN